MRVHATRKLFLFGKYSLALLLPKKWLTELGVERGDSVELELDRSRKRVVLRFSQTQNVSTQKAKVQTEILTTPEPSELQPIPEL